MSVRSEIMTEMDQIYSDLRDVVLVSPNALADKVYKAFSYGNESSQIEYLSVEAAKQMAREYLRRKTAPDGDLNEAHQNEMDFGVKFSGKLQDRYPVPSEDGKPQYKLRSALTPEERAWNCEQLRKTAEALNEHADALEAEGNRIMAA